MLMCASRPTLPVERRDRLEPADIQNLRSTRAAFCKPLAVHDVRRCSTEAVPWIALRTRCGARRVRYLAHYMHSSIAYRRIYCFADRAADQDDGRPAKASDKRGPGNPVQFPNDVSLGSGARRLNDRSGVAAGKACITNLRVATRSTDTTIIADGRALFDIDDPHRGPEGGYEFNTLWWNLNTVSGYLRNNAHTLVNYGARHRKGLPISSSIAESAVNQVVSHRMAKKRQMRWSDEGAHCMVQVRVAVLIGEFSPHRISALEKAASHHGKSIGAASPARHRPTNKTDCATMP